jgi:hypothetical protein
VTTRTERHWRAQPCCLGLGFFAMRQK